MQSQLYTFKVDYLSIYSTHPALSHSSVLGELSFWGNYFCGHTLSLEINTNVMQASFWGLDAPHSTLEVVQFSEYILAQDAYEYVVFRWRKLEK